MAHRKNVSSLGNAQLAQLRTLLDAYIAKPLQDIEGFIVWLSLTIEEFRARIAESNLTSA